MNGLELCREREKEIERERKKEKERGRERERKSRWLLQPLPREVYSGSRLLVQITTARHLDPVPFRSGWNAHPTEFRWCIPRYSLPDIEQWCQGHPEAGSSWPTGVSHLPENAPPKTLP